MSYDGVKSAVKSIVSGGFGGACLVMAGQPFDMIKVKLQTARVVPGQAPEYTGALDAARKIVAREGVRGLYRGMSAPLMGVTPIFAICFLGYDLGKQGMHGLRGTTSGVDQLSLGDIGIAGAFSAVPTTAIMAPGERIKCVMQVEPAGSKRFEGGVSSVVRHILKDGGVASLYRGTVATLLRDGIGSFAYFGVYEGLKRGLTPKDSKLSPLAVVTAGGFAGVCNWALAIPFDVIKTRIQTAEAADVGKGIVQHAREMLAKEGVSALYKGAGPAMLRAFPANAACFLGMETSLSLLNKMF